MSLKEREETSVKGDLRNVIASLPDGKSLRNDHDPALVEGILLLKLPDLATSCALDGLFPEANPAAGSAKLRPWYSL